MIDPSLLFGLTGWKRALVGDTAGNAYQKVVEEKRFSHNGRLILRSCFERDEHGRCVKETRYNEIDKPVGSVCYHTRNGNLTEESWKDQTGSVSCHVEHMYNDNGLLQFSVFQDLNGFPLRWTEFGYNADKRLILLRKGTCGSTTQKMYRIHYTASGKINNVELLGSNGNPIMVTTYHYGDNLLTDAGTTTSVSGISMHYLVFDYDNDGNCTGYSSKGSGGKCLMSCIYAAEQNALTDENKIVLKNEVFQVTQH